MEIFIAALIFVALCVFGLCFNIIFRKDGKFPETEIENNIEMRKRGIKCAKEEEIKLWGKKDKDGKVEQEGIKVGECKIVEYKASGSTPTLSLIERLDINKDDEGKWN